MHGHVMIKKFNKITKKVTIPWLFKKYSETMKFVCALKFSYIAKYFVNASIAIRIADKKYANTTILSGRSNHPCGVKYCYLPILIFLLCFRWTVESRLFGFVCNQFLILACQFIQMLFFLADFINH